MSKIYDYAGRFATPSKVSILLGTNPNLGNFTPNIPDLMEPEVFGYYRVEALTLHEVFDVVTVNPGDYVWMQSTQLDWYNGGDADVLITVAALVFWNQQFEPEVAVTTRLNTNWPKGKRIVGRMFVGVDIYTVRN